MSRTIFNMSVSLDGFVSGLNHSVDELFRWYMAGDTDFQYPGTDMVFRVSKASADLMQEYVERVGVIVTGRTNFDVAKAWGGNPPLGVPHVVVTHSPPREWTTGTSPFTFVTDGVEAALRLAEQIAGGRDVCISTANVLQQCLRADLVDEIHLDQVDVLLGAGTRLFEGIEATELRRQRLVAGMGVTHLTYEVVR